MNEDLLSLGFAFFGTRLCLLEVLSSLVFLSPGKHNTRLWISYHLGSQPNQKMKRLIGVKR